MTRGLVFQDPKWSEGTEDPSVNLDLSLNVLLGLHTSVYIPTEPWRAILVLCATRDVKLKADYPSQDLGRSVTESSRIMASSSYSRGDLYAF